MTEITKSADLSAVIEALLFASENPLALADFVRLLTDDAPPAEAADAPAPGRTEAEIKAAIAALQTAYDADPARGFYLVEVGGGYHLRTKSEFSLYLQRLHKEKPHRLSRSAMETLSVVAYHQPAPRSAIEDIRGVDSSSALRTLLDRGLIRAVGRSDEVGHPVLYGTTPAFLEVFNLRDLESLPPLDSLDSLKQSLRSESDRALEATAAEDAALAPMPFSAIASAERFSVEAEVDKALIGELEEELGKLSSVQDAVVSTVFQAPVPQAGDNSKNA